LKKTKGEKKQHEVAKPGKGGSTEKKKRELAGGGGCNKKKKREPFPNKSHGTQERGTKK